MAQIYKTNGKIIEVEPENGKDFKLKELYKHTDCDCVTIVPLRLSKKLMVADDNGYANNKKANLRATDIYYQNTKYMHIIVGDVLICDPKQIK